MNLREWALFHRASKVGHPALSGGEAAERIVTLGWLCMAGAVLAAFLFAAYAAI